MNHGYEQLTVVQHDQRTQADLRLRGTAHRLAERAVQPDKHR
jgi:hypothetical protein